MSKDSILYASIRCFFITLFSVVAVGVALIPLFLIISVLSGIGEAEIERSFKLEMLPNPNGERKVLAKSTPVILNINISGIIGTEFLNRSTIRNLLIESREGELKNNRVKAVMLRINSPGGTIVDADTIFELMKAYKEQYKIPVYAYVDGLCASGGMYVALAADKIYASEVSLIGSVGVISPSFVNVSDTLDKVGMKALTLIAGKGKDDMNPLRPWRPDEQKSYQKIIDYYYNHFVDFVVANRPAITREKLVEDYGAHVFPASQAKEYGYIDGSGTTFNETITLLAKAAGIEDNNYQVVEMESRSWLTQFFRGDFSLLHGKVKHEIRLTPETDPNLQGKFLYLYRP